MIVALDFYLLWKGNPPGKKSPEIADLSSFFNKLHRKLGTSGTETLRNLNGVYMKIMNFRRFDPVYKEQGKKGLSRGNKLEGELWSTFAPDRERLQKLSKSIRNAIDTESEILEVGNLTQDLPEIEAVEGRVLTILHAMRERSRKLVTAKKAEALKQSGKLACEACEFNFAHRYGTRGAGFIECHHIRPLETLGDGTPTKLSDLGLLCSNCHRMIHCSRPWLSVAELRALVQATSGSPA